MDDNKDFDLFWKQIDGYIKNIRDEARSAKPDFITIDFYLFKLERRVKILKDYINETKNEKPTEA
ncbi:MAG TPA: hypothetical protein VMV77_09040 [Bacteroidales bacterium]|nr:hypothetical protein [Bacteroidales bacterium]